MCVNQIIISTLYIQGFCKTLRAMLKLGLLDSSQLDKLQTGSTELTWVSSGVLAIQRIVLLCGEVKHLTMPAIWFNTDHVTDNNFNLLKTMDTNL